jgi:nitronate monooxygenase
MQTWLTRRLGIDLPLIQAPMAGVSDGRLAAAVSGAGGFGMVAAGPKASAEWIAEQAQVAGVPGKPYGIGLLAWALPDNPQQLDAVVESDAALVAVSYGALEDPIRRLKEAGKTVTTQAGNLDDARRAEAAGVDFVVARGAEGGGHGRNDIATLPLLELVLDQAQVPVVAAGGIATARGLAAVLAAGAAGGWVGTRFLTCQESRFPAAARSRLIAAGDNDTAYGRVFDLAQRAAWPAEFGGRALRNAFFAEWEHREDELAADPTVAERYSRAAKQQDFDTAVIYAGQTAALLRSEPTAAEVVAEFRRADDLLLAVLSGYS